jgi:signal transduction histidine kinase
MLDEITSDVLDDGDLVRSAERQPDKEPSGAKLCPECHAVQQPGAPECWQCGHVFHAVTLVRERLLLPDKSIKYLQVVARATRDQNGQLDVTQRRLSEEALGKIRSELAHVARVTSLGAMTASIAHEVNQPLSGIITNASTCLRMLATDPPNIDGARDSRRQPCV